MSAFAFKKKLPAQNPIKIGLPIKIPNFGFGSILIHSYGKSHTKICWHKHKEKFIKNIKGDHYQYWIKNKRSSYKTDQIASFLAPGRFFFL